MASSAQTVPGFPVIASLRGKAATALVIASMAAALLWSSGHDDQRCVQLVLLALLAPLMLAGKGIADQIAWMGRPSRSCLGAFFALGTVSTLAAFSLRHAFYEWSLLLLLLLAAALIATELARSGAAGLQFVLRSVVVIGVLYSLRITLMYAALLASGVQPDMQALFVGFSNARFFNHAQTVPLPLAVLLYLQAPANSGWRRTAFALAAFWWALLFVSEARASLLALAAGCVLAFAVRRSQARGFLKAMALTALAGAIVYGLLFVLLPMLAGLQPFSAAMNVVQRTAADPTSRRNLLWQLALELIAAHPLLGVGPHHFAHEGAALSWGAHPHDFIMQIGAEWGLPALLCMLAAIGMGLRALVRSGAGIATTDTAGQQTLAVMLATGAAILVDGLFSGVLVMPVSQTAIMLYLACAAGWMRSLDTSAPHRATALARWLTPALAALAAVALFGVAYGVAPNLERHARHAALTPAEKAINPVMQWPRMWEAGYF